MPTTDSPDASTVLTEVSRVLGLQEIVLGGVATYLIWVARGLPQLPGTGYVYIDAGLIVCVAAIAGRLVAGAADGAFHIVNLCLFRTANLHLNGTVPNTRPWFRLFGAMNAYRMSRGALAIESGRKAFDSGMMELARAWPSHFAALRSMRLVAVTLYSYGALALLGALAMADRAQTANDHGVINQPSSVLLLLLAGGLLVAVGLFRQLEMIGALTDVFPVLDMTSEPSRDITTAAPSE